MTTIADILARHNGADNCFGLAEATAELEQRCVDCRALTAAGGSDLREQIQRWKTEAEELRLELNYRRELENRMRK